MREVQLGDDVDATTRVVAGGVGEGDRVVLAGAFHLNNERKRAALQGA
jgi:hypothetical protein